MCVKWGLPAQSPTAQTPGAVVRSRSSTLMKPRSSRSIPGGLEADAVGVRRAAARDQEVGSLDRLRLPGARRVQLHRLAGSPLDAVDARVREDLDPLVVEELCSASETSRSSRWARASLRSRIVTRLPKRRMA